MQLHIGQNTSLSAERVVGVFDMDTTSQSRYTQRLLSAAQKAGRVVNVTAELPKSFVVACPPVRRHGERSVSTIYISQISSRTLKKRADYQLSDLTEDLQ